MNIAIYARVSTAAQAEKGYSLETQVEACRTNVNAEKKTKKTLANPSIFAYNQF